jgi:hypothetical protein
VIPERHDPLIRRGIKLTCRMFIFFLLIQIALQQLCNYSFLKGLVAIDFFQLAENQKWVPKVTICDHGSGHVGFGLCWVTGQNSWLAPDPSHCWVGFWFFSCNFRVWSGFFLILVKMLAYASPVTRSGRVSIFRWVGFGRPMMRHNCYTWTSV